MSQNPDDDWRRSLADAKAAKAEAWRIEHEQELERRAEAKRTEREARREENRRLHWESVETEKSRQVETSLARKQENTRAWVERQSPESDPFVVDMAARFKHVANSPNPIPGYEPGTVGCTPAEFIAWQGRQRELMRQPQSQSEIDEIMRRAR